MSRGRPRLPEDTKQRAYARRYNRRRKERLRPIHRKIIEDFLSNPCVDCGVQYPLPAMEPDHVRGKKYKISWFKDGNGSTKALLAELAKCEVRCANCHAIRHANGGTCNG